MALPSSGTISLSQVAVELNRAATATTSLGETAVRTLAGVPTGAISLSNLWGKSNIPQRGYALANAGNDIPGAISYIDLVNETNTNLTAASGIGGYSNGFHSNTEGFNAMNAVPASNPLAFQVSKLSFTTGTYVTPFTASSVYFYSLYGNHGANGPLGKGYIGGGGLTNPSSIILGLIYSSGSTLNQSAVMSVGRSQNSHFSSQSYGFIAGGNGTYSTRYTTIDAIFFGTETSSALSATLSVGVFGPGGWNSSVAGYTPSGFDSGSVTRNHTDKLLFSSQTLTTLSTTQNRGVYGATNSSNSKGYNQGGTTTYDPRTPIALVHALTFSTDTQVQLSNGLAAAKWGMSSVTSGGGL